MRRHSLPVNLLLLLFGIACDSDSPIDLESSPPQVTSTVDFGDPPVSGFVEISASAEEWSYKVDIGADASVDHSGVVKGITRIPYEFDSPGVHPILIHTSRHSISHSHTRYVVVNDVGAFAAPRLSSVQPENESLPFEGIVVSDRDDAIYVGEAGERRIIAVSTTDLAELDAFEAGQEPRGFLEGFVLTPSENKLFVIDKLENVQGFALPELERIVDLRNVAEAQHFIMTVSESEFWVGNPGLAHVSDTGTVFRAVGSEARVWHFDVHENVALLQLGGGRLGNRDLADNPSLALVSPELNILWETPFAPGFAPASVAFAEDPHWLYVVGTLDSEWRFVRLDSQTGEVVYEMQLGPTSAADKHSGAANPVAELLGGRYIAFATTIGTFLVDTEIHLPVLRTPLPHFLFCCDVAASRTQGVLYFANERLVQLTFNP